MGRPRIDFSNSNDLQVLVLGSLGFATDYIAAKTKRSPGQIAYRLRIGGVKRADYRNGTGATARLVLSNVHTQAVAMAAAQARKARVAGRQRQPAGKA